MVQNERNEIMKKKISKLLEKITTGLMYAFAASTIAFFGLMLLDCFFGVFSHLSDTQVQTLGFSMIGTVLGTLFGTLTIGANTRTACSATISSQKD